VAAARTTFYGQALPQVPLITSLEAAAAVAAAGLVAALNPKP